MDDHDFWPKENTIDEMVAEVVALLCKSCEWKTRCSEECEFCDAIRTVFSGQGPAQISARTRGAASAAK